MSRYLVTGGAGFVGCHLVERLVRDGHEVVAVDNERSGDWSRLRVACERHHRDIVDLTKEEWAHLCGGVDAVFHLAAEKYNSSKSTPERVIGTNIVATQRLADGAVMAGVRKIVFTSSLYAYGSLGPEPMRETDVPYPRTTYGMSKIAGEHQLRVAGVSQGLNWAVARLFFVYGPRQFAEGGYKSVIVVNFERLARSEQPVIFGDGLQALDYIYVDDVIESLLKLAEPCNDRVIVNIGAGCATTVAEMTAMMIDVSGKQTSPRFAPADWTAGTARYSSNHRMIDEVGLTPMVSLRDGLERTWADMRSSS